MRDQPVMKRDTMFRHARGRHLDLHPGHVDADRALALAGLAGHAQLHGLGHRIACQRVRTELARDGKAQRVRAPAHRVAFIAGGAVGRAHHPALQLAAGTVVVAHLDGPLKAAGRPRPFGPVQQAVDTVHLISGRKAEQAAVIHFRGIGDLAGVEHALRVEHRLDLTEQVGKHRPEHPVVEFGADNAVTMFTGMRTAELAHQRKGLFGDGTHRLGPGGLFHVQHRAHMKTPDRRMRIPGALRVMPVENLCQPVGIFGKVLQLDSAILKERDRLCLILHAHHDVEAGFAPFRDPSLHRRINGIHHPAAPVLTLVPAEAEIAHHVVEPAQTGLILGHVLFGEFHQQQRGRVAAHRLFHRRLEDRDGAGQFNHRVVDQLDRNRIKGHKMLRRIHRLVEGREMADPHQLLCRQRRELQLDRGAEGQRAFRADKKMREVDAVAGHAAGAQRHRIRHQRIDIISADAPQNLGEAVNDIAGMRRAHRQQPRLQVSQKAGRRGRAKVTETRL